MAGIIDPNIAFGPQKVPPSTSLSEIYHENTKLHPLTIAGMAPSAKFSNHEIQAMARGYKKYPLCQSFSLPPIEKIPSKLPSFDEVVSSRRSYRNFEDAELSLKNLSKVLQQSFGVTGKLPVTGGEVQLLRAAPSGGALYPAEIYLGIRKVENLDPGLYHYNVPEHKLEKLKSQDQTDRIYDICCDQTQARQSAVTFLISGVLPRTKSKYGERGYRYVLLDVGHLGQNIYLSCTALDLAVMTTCGFFDDEGNKLLKIDGVDETLLYVAFVGNKAKK